MHLGEGAGRAGPDDGRPQRILKGTRDLEHRIRSSSETTPTQNNEEIEIFTSPYKAVEPTVGATALRVFSRRPKIGADPIE